MMLYILLLFTTNLAVEQMIFLYSNNDNLINQLIYHELATFLPRKVIIKTVVGVLTYTFPLIFSLGYQLEFGDTSKESAVEKELTKIKT